MRVYMFRPPQTAPIRAAYPKIALFPVYPSSFPSSTSIPMNPPQKGFHRCTMSAIGVVEKSNFSNQDFIV